MISVEFTGRFLECVQRLGLDRAAVFAAMQTTATAWGTPHLHAGIGIRRLKGNWFEALTGLNVRLVFQVRKGCLTFHFAGNHEAVKRFARDL